MFKRLKTAWKLSKTPEVGILAMMEAKQKALDDAEKAIRENTASIGDGNAVFFGEPDEKEELEYERELEGTLPWYKRILR